MDGCREAWGRRLALLTLGFGLCCEVQAHAQLIALRRRIELELLVLSAGDLATQSVMAGLREAGVPYHELRLLEPGRPVIDAQFLADSPSMFVKRAKFQAIVAPNQAPEGLTGAEVEALASYQREFGIRRLDSYVYPSPSLGLRNPLESGWIGSLDGMVAQVTPEARRAGFGYLAGPLPFDDHSADQIESYGYLAPPLMAAGPSRALTPFVVAPLPGRADSGVLVAVRQDAGRESMFVTCALHPSQLQQQALFPGVLRWLTRGVHLGSERNYFSVHVDDLFLANTRWIPAHDCTTEGDCPAGVDAPALLMTPADVDYLLAWQRQHGFGLWLAFNGGGYGLALEHATSFPLGDKLLAHASELRWINHTYTHEYLGCVHDTRSRPLRCLAGEGGGVRWVPHAQVVEQIAQNLAFAAQHGLAVDPAALVTGEHSGLRRAPDEPSDNPNLLRALDAQGIAWIAADHSREPEQRSVAGARSVPRYPMNVFFNVGTREEEVDEYNFIYTRAADGGSGLCETVADTSCIVPLDPATGFEAYIVPREARIALLHALSNSPRPHFAHQSNLGHDRLLYPILEKLLADYRRVFAPTAPLLDLSLAEAGRTLEYAASWSRNRERVRAYLESGRLVLRVSGSGGVQVPLTLPAATALDGKPLLDAYAGVQTGYRRVLPLLNQTLPLPAGLGYAE